MNVFKIHNIITNNISSSQEIKSDCSEKLISEPTTELAAGTVEVKE